MLNTLFFKIDVLFNVKPDKNVKRPLHPYLTNIVHNQPKIAGVSGCIMETPATSIIQFYYKYYCTLIKAKTYLTKKSYVK